MRNTFSDNLAEHSLDTAVIAHCLCIIGNIYFGKALDAERCAVLALYHDASEIITGDMPTPIKYYSENLRALYKDCLLYTSQFVHISFICGQAEDW